MKSPYIYTFLISHSSNMFKPSYNDDDLKTCAQFGDQ